jgi:hypothetical protein
MKTAMQDLINKFEEIKDLDYMVQIMILRSESQQLLEKEKKQINKSFLDGFKYSGEGYNGEYPFEGCTDESIYTSIDLDRYYQETFSDSNQAGI